MKKKILLFLGCVALAAVMVFNVQLVKSDSSNGSHLTLNRILKLSSAQAEGDKDTTKVGYWKNYVDLGNVCVPTGTSC